MKNSTNIKEFLNTFFATISRQRLEKMLRGKKITLEEVKVESSEKVYGKYLSMIMLWSSVGSINLKLHFDLEMAKLLASDGLETKKENITQDIALDFMKECCNGVGGFVRSLFEKDKMQMGMSLPFLAEGCDELIFRKIRDPRSTVSIWKLALESGETFILSLEICLLDPKSIESLRTTFENAIIDGDSGLTSEGDVDFSF